MTPLAASLGWILVLDSSGVCRKGLIDYMLPIGAPASEAEGRPFESGWARQQKTQLLTIPVLVFAVIGAGLQAIQSYGIPSGRE